MVHFHNSGSKTDDYITLVDSEVLPEFETVPATTYNHQNDQPQPKPEKHGDRGMCTRNRKICINSGRNFTMGFILVLLVAVIVLSYEAYRQSNTVDRLRVVISDQNNIWRKLGYKSAPRCDFVISDLRHGFQRSRRIGDQVGDACVDACVHMKRIDPVINGVTTYVDETKKGCWCQRNMTSVSRRFKACFIKSNGTKAAMSAVRKMGSAYTCNFISGDGTGGTEVNVGNHEGEACVNACLHLKQFDNTVNGVTMFTDPNRAGCWCEKGMSRIYNLMTYKTCYLVPVRNTSKTIDKNICNLTIGYSKGGSKFNIGRRVASTSQCLDDCIHMRRVDPSINGVTVNPKNGNCYCSRRMLNITGRYKSCFLKPAHTDVKMDSAANATNVTDAETNVRYDCNFVIGYGVSTTSQRIGGQAGQACVMACTHMKKIDETINGVTVFADPSKGGCFCRRNMTRIDGVYRTCFLTKPTQTPIVAKAPNETLPTCQLTPGDGSGGTEIYLGKLDGSVCFQACLHLKKIDDAVNGMTVHSNNTKPGCWCERRMTGRRKSRLYSTCRFIFNDTSDTVDTSQVCRFENGAGVPSSPLKRGLVGRLEEAECVESCLHMQRINPDINGITRSTITKRCWCESNMKSIGEYKTCFLTSHV